MQPVCATKRTRQTTARKLTIIAEGPHGLHRRIELVVTPGMTVGELSLDESYTRLVQPGGVVLADGDDLFEIGADTPKLFALRDAPTHLPQPVPMRHRASSLTRLHGYGAVWLQRSSPGQSHDTEQSRRSYSFSLIDWVRRAKEGRHEVLPLPPRQQRRLLQVGGVTAGG
jgi:hypothetical protein